MGRKTRKPGPLPMLPEQLRRWNELKRSNAAGVHRNRADRRQNRRTRRERAIRESLGEA